MLHYVHQLVTNFVCMLFGAGQVVYIRLIRPYSLKIAACCSWNKVDTITVTLKGWKTKIMSYSRLKHPVKLRGTEDSSDNYL